MHKKYSRLRPGSFGQLFRFLATMQINRIPLVYYEIFFRQYFNYPWFIFESNIC